MVLDDPLGPADRTVGVHINSYVASVMNIRDEVSFYTSTVFVSSLLSKRLVSYWILSKAAESSAPVLLEYTSTRTALAVALVIAT
jgi:hypothetical protein